MAKPQWSPAERPPGLLNDKSFLMLGVSAVAALVVGLICRRLELDVLAEPLTGIAAGLPAAIAFRAQWRKSAARTAANPYGPPVPNTLAPALVAVLFAGAVLVVDSLVGAIEGAIGTFLTEGAFAVLAIFGTVVSVLAYATLTGWISKRFGVRPYLWTVATIAIILALRLLIVVLLGMTQLIPSLIVIYLIMLGLSLLATLIFTRSRAGRIATPMWSAPVQPLGWPAPPGWPGPVSAVPGPVSAVPAPAAPPVWLPPAPAVPPVPHAPTPPPAAWYPDPELRGVIRYWDGTHWTDHRRNG